MNELLDYTPAVLRYLLDYTPAELRDLLDYNPRTGVLTWRQDRGQVRAGEQVNPPEKRGWKIRQPGGTPRPVLLCIDGTAYPASAIAWMIARGEAPLGVITYRNGNPWDLRLANLGCTVERLSDWRKEKRKEREQGKATKRGALDHLPEWLQ